MYVIEKHGDIYTLLLDGICVKGDIGSRVEADRWKKMYENRDSIQSRKPELVEKLAKWRESNHKARLARCANRSRRVNK